jgi:hypothetical protein
MGPQLWELRKFKGEFQLTDDAKSFNGAAALGAAEMCFTVAAVAAWFGASMGPQLWELRKFI